MSELTDKQHRFCEEYLVDLNATQAAIRAGYSKKTAKEIGCENLSKPNLQELISRLMKERSERTNVTADTTLTELAIIAHSNIFDYVVFKEDGKFFYDLERVPAHKQSAIRTVFRNEYGEVTRIEFWDKNKALAEIGKHTGVGQKIDVTSGGQHIDAAVVISMPDNGRGQPTW